MYGLPTSSGLFSVRTDGYRSISFKDCVNFNCERVERNLSASRCAACCGYVCGGSFCCCSCNSSCRRRLSSSLVYMLWQSSLVPLSPSRRAILFERKRYYCKAPASDGFRECTHSTKEEVGRRGVKRKEKSFLEVNSRVASNNVDEVLSLLCEDANDERLDVEEIRFSSTALLGKLEGMGSYGGELHHGRSRNDMSERVKSDWKYVSELDLRKEFGVNDDEKNRAGERRKLKEEQKTRDNQGGAIYTGNKKERSCNSSYCSPSSFAEYPNDNAVLGVRCDYSEKLSSKKKDRRYELDRFVNTANETRFHTDSVEVEKRVLNEFPVEFEEQSNQRTGVEWDMKRTEKKKLAETQLKDTKLNSRIPTTLVSDYHRDSGSSRILDEDEIALSSLHLDKRKENKVNQLVAEGAATTSSRREKWQDANVQEIYGKKSELGIVEEMQEMEDLKMENIGAGRLSTQQTPSCFQVKIQEGGRVESAHKLPDNKDGQLLVEIGLGRLSESDCGGAKHFNLQSVTTGDKQTCETVLGSSLETVSYKSGIDNKSQRMAQILKESQDVTNTSLNVTNSLIAFGDHSENPGPKLESIATLPCPQLALKSHCSSSVVGVNDGDFRLVTDSKRSPEWIPSVKGSGKTANTQSVTSEEESKLGTVFSSSSSSSTMSYDVNFDKETSRMVQLRQESKAVSNISLNVTNVSVVCAGRTDDNKSSLEGKTDRFTGETNSGLQSAVESQNSVDRLDVTGKSIGVEAKTRKIPERFVFESDPGKIINMQSVTTDGKMNVETVVDSSSSMGTFSFESNIDQEKISLAQSTKEYHDVTNLSLDIINVSVVRGDKADESIKVEEGKAVIQESKPIMTSTSGFSNDGTIFSPQLTLETQGSETSFGNVSYEKVSEFPETTKMGSNPVALSSNDDLGTAQYSVGPFGFGVETDEKIRHGSSYSQYGYENVIASTSEGQGQEKMNISVDASLQLDNKKLGRSSSFPKMKSPSENLWDTKQDSSEEPYETEASEEGVSKDKIVIKRSGKSLWTLIANVVRLRWGSHAESSRLTSSGGKNSSNESNSSETWFSGNEHDDSADGISKGVSSDKVKQMGSSPKDPEGIVRPEKHIKQDLSEVDTGRLKQSLPAPVSTSYEESNVGAVEMSSEIITFQAPVPDVIVSGTGTEGDHERGEADNSSNSSVTEMTSPLILAPNEEIQVSQGRPRKMLQRTKQVLRDRFDTWEEAYTIESEQRKHDEIFMKEALIEAKKAGDIWEVPVGAVLVQNGNIIARGHNLVEELRDSTAHAEMICIRKASNELNSWRLADTTLYVTLEPCPMCAGAILQARISALVWGAPNKLLGADGSWIRLFPSGEEGSSDASDKMAPPAHPFHPNMKIRRGILASECADVMQQFFQLRRRKRSKPEDDQRSQSTTLPIANRPAKFVTKMHNIFHSMLCM